MGKTYKDTRKAKGDFVNDTPRKGRRRPHRRRREEYQELKGWSYKDVSDIYKDDTE